MGLNALESALLSDGGVSGGMRLARLVLRPGTAREVVLSNWQPCLALGLS